ncbi:hypothetical protein DUB92_10590 [Salmonella enterica subsp. diarizonae]|nr:hypothetical protein [Salmonella enterica subsp. diarizonae]ECJ5849621.1 hypothetical protein [Salmonella enterica subsp. diarizonae]
MWPICVIADGCAYLDGAESATNARSKDNNNPRARGDFFYLNSLRRVLFYGANDGSCYQCHLSLSPRGY